jgi:hypothetical protein
MRVRRALNDGALQQFAQRKWRGAKTGCRINDHSDSAESLRRKKFADGNTFVRLFA